MKNNSIKFSIGYNHDLKFIDHLSSYTNNVDSLYFPISQSILGSGRCITQRNTYDEEIDLLLKKCTKLGIKSNILINATCEGKLTANKEHMERVINHLTILKNNGLSAATITNPQYMIEIDEKIPELEIHSSVNCFVKNVESALHLKELGTNVLTIDRDINRDINLIKKIKDESNLPIKIMLNEGCLSNCPYRKFHFNGIAHLVDDDFYYRRICQSYLQKHPEKVFRIPFIRPEDLYRYKGIADYFKLATRTFKTNKIMEILNAYVDQSYDGNLLDLFTTLSPKSALGSIDNKSISPDFFDKLSECDLNCTKCNYCKNLLKTTLKKNGSNLSKEWDELYVHNKFKMNFGYKNPDEHVIKMFELIKPPEDSKILDMGCGTGKNASFLENEGLKVWGIDFSKNAISFCKSNYKDIKFTHCDARGIPFDSEFFDIVLDAGCMHVNPPKDHSSLISEISRVLKKGGFLVSRIFKREETHDKNRPLFYESANKKAPVWGLNKKEIFNLLKDFERIYFEESEDYADHKIFFLIFKKR